MTRINVGIKPSELSPQHLLAEHREIKRIPNNVKSGKAKLTNIPETFKLGTGHVKFFYNKLGYLYKRYCAIYDECIKRSYKVQSYHEAWDGIPEHLMGDYTPTAEDRKLLLQRIAEKLNSTKA